MLFSSSRQWETNNWHRSYVEALGDNRRLLSGLHVTLVSKATRKDLVQFSLVFTLIYVADFTPMSGCFHADLCGCVQSNFAGCFSRCGCLHSDICGWFYSVDGFILWMVLLCGWFYSDFCRRLISDLCGCFTVIWVDAFTAISVNCMNENTQKRGQVNGGFQEAGVGLAPRKQSMVQCYAAVTILSPGRHFYAAPLGDWFLFRYFSPTL